VAQLVGPLGVACRMATARSKSRPKLLGVDFIARTVSLPSRPARNRTSRALGDHVIKHPDLVGAPGRNEVGGHGELAHVEGSWTRSTGCPT
jgi:hypothetical protein